MLINFMFIFHHVMSTFKNDNEYKFVLFRRTISITMTVF